MLATSPPPQHLLPCSMSPAPTPSTLHIANAVVQMVLPSLPVSNCSALAGSPPHGTAQALRSPSASLTSSTNSSPTVRSICMTSTPRYALSSTMLGLGNRWYVFISPRCTRRGHLTLYSSDTTSCLWYSVYMYTSANSDEAVVVTLWADSPLSQGVTWPLSAPRARIPVETCRCREVS